MWAPDAERVDLHLPPDRVVPLSRSSDGWWSSPQNLAAGTSYAFAVDGGDPRPDPRSPWQPQGVHAPSRSFAADAHVWTDQDWTGCDIRGAVLYELHVGTFTAGGTLDTAVERLDHLVDLGVDVVELMPVAAFPGVYGWGYDGVALYAVHEPYGGPAALQRFVDAAHRRGLGVCLDVVYNHLGPSGNYLSEFGPYFTDRHHTPWGQAVNLDGPGAHGVRAFVVDNALRWLRDFHLDALRLDAVHALLDESPRHVLAELSDAVTELSAELGRPLSLIAESDLNDATMVTPTGVEGRDGRTGLGMTAQWADDVHHAVHALLTGERHGYYVDFGSVQTLMTALTRVFVHNGGWSTFRGQPWGQPLPAATDGHRFVVFASDHDQVGNRALGDRPSASGDTAGDAIAAALVLTSACTPMIFMGEEWGARTPWQFFTDHAEPELVDAIRQGRVAEFGGHGWAGQDGGRVEVPDPQASTTIESSMLDWSELTAAPHARLLDWYRRLIALRRSEPDLASGDLDGVSVERGPDDSWIVLRRGAVRIVVTLADEPVLVPLYPSSPSVQAQDGRPGRVHVLAAWDEAVAEDGGVRLPGRSVAVVRVAARTPDEPLRKG